MRPGDYVRTRDGGLREIESIYGIRDDGTVLPPSQGGFGVVTLDGERLTMWQIRSYHKHTDVAGR